jgi:hypothetical protein
MGEHGSSGPRVSIVVPALDAATNVYFVLRQLPDADEVILVDGGSGDGTSDAARQARPDVKVLVRPGASRTAALAAGFEHASGDVILTLPIDGSVDPEEIPTLLAALVAGADVAKGSRYAGPTGGPTAGDRALAWLARRLHRAQLTDLSFGFYGFWARHREALSLPTEGTGSWSESADVAVLCQLARSGAHIVEVPCRRMAPLFGTDELRGPASFLTGARAVLAERRRSRTARRAATRVVAAPDPDHTLV